MINLRRLTNAKGLGGGVSFKHILFEIVLVTGGILIALAIDNWNNKRVEQAEIKYYYKDIQVEFKETINYQKGYQKTLQYLKNSMTRSLEIIKSKNKDSIPVLKKLLGTLATTWPVSYTMPITQEFIDLDYINKVENDSLKTMLKKYVRQIERSKGLAEYNEAQYNDRIEPYINENINYREIVLGNSNSQLVIGGPKTDFEKLSNDLKFWNIINFKIETTIIELDRLKGDMKVFEIIYNLLEDENKN
jgi:hypothetical protein